MGFLVVLKAGSSGVNSTTKQLVKIFSQIFSTDLTDMTDHLNKGDVSNPNPNPFLIYFHF